MTSSFTVAEEFPDYPLADLPQIPEGFEDASWHNDVCPSFVSDPIGLTLWVDYKDPDKREHPETPRFSLQSQKDGIETSEFWLDSDNWDEILAAIEKRRIERNAPPIDPTTGRPANFRRENGDWVTIAEGE